MATTTFTTILAVGETIKVGGPGEVAIKASKTASIIKTGAAKAVVPTKLAMAQTTTAKLASWDTLATKLTATKAATAAKPLIGVIAASQLASLAIPAIVLAGAGTSLFFLVKAYSRHYQ